jgi:hypothetical protein
MIPCSAAGRLASLCVRVVFIAAIAASTAGADTVVTVPFKGPRQVEEIQARGIEIVAATKHGLDVLADDAGLAWLLTRPYPVSVLRPDDGLAPAGVLALGPTLGSYHTYAELDSLLGALAASYPAVTQRSTIGTSIEGRNIYALKISDNVTVDEDEPEVLYMGNHHARELMSVDIPLRFAAYLLANYGVDSEITSYIDNREIWFVPMVNPDGYYYVQLNHGGTPNSWWRKNRRDNGNFTFGVDLNRNYGWMWGFDNVGSSPTPGSDIYRGSAAFSEPETQAIRNFVNARDFTMWFSYHTYGELLLYPWGYYYGDTPDHAVYAALGDSLVLENGYLAGNPASGAIYITNGSSDDWGYGQQVSHDKVFAFTPEMNSLAQGGFGPDDALIQPTFDLLLPMNLKLLRFAANPYMVAAPWAPAQYAAEAPYGNGITRVSWTASAATDPNPAAHYELQACLDPSFFTDAGTLNTTDWVTAGFSYSGGMTGGGYWSGSGDQLSHSMRMSRSFVVGAESDTLTFHVNYVIETDYDYGYVDVSTDGGTSWTPIQGNITTSADPNGLNRGHGFTGSSAGWVGAVFPLTAYAGQEINLRYSYFTDQSVVQTGYFIDDIHPVATCASESLITTADADTTYDHVPGAAGLWRYRVRAVDAESHASAWSNLRDRDVATVTAADAPRGFQTRLGANVPNPFNPTTRIPYVVGGAPGAAPARVELVVYSVTGARVATLVAESKAPGTYAARWTGANDRGEPMPSGVYFARLTVGGVPAEARKLVLLK